MKKANKINKFKKKNTSVFSSDNEMAKLILLIVIVVLAFAIFYIITLFVIKNKEDKAVAEETTEATIQYEKILVSNILSQSNSEYYVLAYTNDDAYLEAYKNNLVYYEMAKEDSVPYYLVELDNTFNRNFKSETSQLNVDNSKDFKFKETTLLRIKDGKVNSTYEGKDNITAKLSRMSK